MIAIFPAKIASQYWLARSILSPAHVITIWIFTVDRALNMAIDPIIHAGIHAKDTSAMIVFIGTVVQTTPVFRRAL